MRKACSRKRIPVKVPILVVAPAWEMDALEIKQRASIQAFVRGCANTSHYDLFKDMANLVLILDGYTSKHPNDSFVKDMVFPALQGISDRYRKVNRLGVTSSELKVLKDFIIWNKQFWQSQSLDLYVVCVNELIAFNNEVA